MKPERLTLSADRKEALRELQARIESEGMAERRRSDFSLRDFARRTVLSHIHEPVVVVYALNSVARNYFSGNTDPLMSMIADALDLDKETPRDEVARKMMPYLQVGGGAVARAFLAQKGFTNEEIERYTREADMLHDGAMRRGELNF